MFDKFKQLGELKKMRDEALRIQRELAAEKIELEEGDIKIVVSGDQKVQSLEIRGEAQPSLIEVLNKALKRSQEVAAKKVQQMSGGLSGLLGKCEDVRIFLMNLPRSIRNLVEAFEKLPGIGPKTAQRLVFYLLHVPQEQLDEFAEATQELKRKTVLCSLCFNVAETDPCSVCTNQNRDKSIICVVEQPIDVLVLEKAGSFKGVYHVLHGAISPLNNIGPDELYIKQLLQRIKNSVQPIKEIILAMNPNMEGEATAMYLAKEIKKIKDLKITRLGQGLPTGADLEYADEITLARALEGRKEF